MQQTNPFPALIIHDFNYSFLQRRDFIPYTPTVAAENRYDGKQILGSPLGHEEWSQNEDFRMEWLKMQVDGNPKMKNLIEFSHRNVGVKCTQHE